MLHVVCAGIHTVASVKELHSKRENETQYNGWFKQLLQGYDHIQTSESKN